MRRGSRTAPARRHALPFGAELCDDGVRFRLWAPRAAAVSLQLEDLAADSAEIPMQSEPGGWFSLTTDRATAGTRYRYVLDGAAVPDPASRFQPDGVHGPSEVIDPAAYRWHDDGWRGRAWEEIVVYELHLGTFSPAGDFAGAIGRLDHLRALGVTAIELMPIAEFAGRRNWGYDGVQLYAPSSCYGRPEALKALVEVCHMRGLAVLLDVVYNHFGPEGNYLPRLSPDFFTDRHHTPWGAAIAYAGPHSRPVRDFFMHNALYWLEEFGFDGLRLDAVHAIADDSSPDILTELADTVRSRITGREIHLVLENDRNEARRLARREGRICGYSAQWNDDLHHALHVLVTGQESGYYADYADSPMAHLGRALATGFAYQGELSPFRGGTPRGEPSHDLPATAFVSFLQNHDQIGNTAFGTRIGERVSEPLLHAAIAIVLLSPQIPMLFMGEEWASARPFQFFCDFAPPLDAAVREGRRREFAQFPEFSDPAVRETIPDPTDGASFAASCVDWSEPLEPAHARWLDRYRTLLELRARVIVPRLAGIAPGGSFELLGPTALAVEWRLGDGCTLRLLANFAGDPIPLPQAVDRDSMIYSSGRVPPDTKLPPASATFFLLPKASGR
jgi:malto-oligosyltrehalose trehalohydrolase